MLTIMLAIDADLAIGGSSDENNPSSNALQSFYGIREPVSNNIADFNFLGAQPATPPCQLTWSQIWNDRISPETGGKPHKLYLYNDML